MCVCVLREGQKKKKDYIINTRSHGLGQSPIGVQALEQNLSRMHPEIWILLINAHSRVGVRPGRAGVLVRVHSQ